MVSQVVVQYIKVTSSNNQGVPRTLIHKVPSGSVYGKLGGSLYMGLQQKAPGKGPKVRFSYV